jgi:hypothetical protein
MNKTLLIIIIALLLLGSTGLIMYGRWQYDHHVSGEGWKYMTPGVIIFFATTIVLRKSKL